MKEVIKFPDIAWVKAETEGGCFCPDCGKKMIVIREHTWGYAFCLFCNQYWISPVSGKSQ